MITDVQIQNLRGLAECKLAGVTALTVLTGRNGCGKSTVLDGMLLAASNTPGVDLNRVVFDRLPGVWRPARWLFRDATQAASMAIQAGGLAWSTTLRFEAPGVVSRTVGPAGPQQWELSLTAHGSSYNPGRGQGGAATETWLVEFDRQAPLEELYRGAVERGMRKRVRDRIAAEFAGRTLEPAQVDEGRVELRLVSDDDFIPVRALGLGQQAFVRMTLELAAPPGSLILLEEPEAHLHPGLLRSISSAIWLAVADGVQIVSTTHSLDFVDALLESAPQEQVANLSLQIMARDDAGRASFKRFDHEMIDAARHALAEDLR